MTDLPRVPRHLSRRAVLGGVGAAGVALPAFIAAGGASAVTGGGPPSNPSATTPRVVPSRGFSAAAVTPGLSYQTFSGRSIRVLQGNVSFGDVGVTVNSGPAEFLLPFEHPNTVMIQELEVYTLSAPPGAVAQLVLLQPSTNIRTNIGGSPLALGGSGLMRFGQGYSATVDATLGQAAVNITFDGPGTLLGARIGFEDFVGLTFFPVDPSKREIDTRAIRGRLVAFETYRVALEVPPFAFALVNLTITQTIAAGFLSAFPADISWPGTSSVNWFQSNQDTANLVVVGTDSQGGMNLYCGAGQTHVVVDLQGFYY